MATGGTTAATAGATAGTAAGTTAAATTTNAPRGEQRAGPRSAQRSAQRSGRPDVAPPGANEVRLVGRVSAAPSEQELPSGDRVVALRLVVPRDRPRPRARAGGTTAGATAGATVDTIDVACWSGRARTAALRLRPGEHAEVHGALRRRFFRAGGAAVSRYEVEAAMVRRVRS